MLDNCMVMLVRCFVLLGTWQAKAKHIASEYPENGNRLLGMVGYSLKMKQDLRDNITRWIIYPCVKGNAINLCTDLEPLTQRTSWIWFIEAAICHLEFYEEFTLVILRLWITHTWSHSWNKMPFKKITRCEQLTSKGPSLLTCDLQRSDWHDLFWFIGACSTYFWVYCLHSKAS